MERNRHHDLASTAAAIYRRNCSAKGPPRRRRLELAQSTEGFSCLHGRFPLAKPGRVPQRSRADRGIPYQEMDERTRLLADQGVVGVYREPYRGAFRV